MHRKFGASCLRGMFIGSASIAPKTEISAPKTTAVAQQKVTTSNQNQVSTYTPPRSVPVNLSGGAVQQTGGTAPRNPAGNVPQAWTNTCGANSLMAMEASVDAGRAQQIAGLTGDDRAQFEMGVMNSNDAVDGFQPTDDGSRGWGDSRMREQVADRFVGGLDESLSIREMPDQGTAADTLVTALSDGRPVALGMDGHWMAATDIRGEGEHQEVLIQDSWTGQSAWVPVSQIRNGEDWVTTNFHSEIPKSSAILSTVVPASDQLNTDSTFRAHEGDAGTWAADRMDDWQSLRRTLPDVPTPTAPPATTENPLPAPRWYHRPIAV